MDGCRGAVGWRRGGKGEGVQVVKTFSHKICLGDVKYSRGS